MARYDLYGIGNALVDYEFEVSDEVLKGFEVDKGLMTLVDANLQEKRIAHLEGTRHKRACGGSAANTLIALSQFGGQSYYSCKVANDETGEFFYHDLKANGVHSNVEPGKLPNGTTGTCLVLVTPDAERTMNTHLGISAEFSSSELREEELKQSKILYIEGYLVASDSGRAAAIQAREMAEKHGVKTALTFSDPNMIQFFRDGMKEMLGPKGVDYLFSNDAEAKLYTGAEDIDDVHFELQKIAKNYVVTCGAQGALVYDGSSVQKVGITKSVRPVDSNGAGDMFAGAFLYGVTEGWDLVKSAGLANLAAGALVTQYGPRLKMDQTRAVLSEFES